VRGVLVYKLLSLFWLVNWFIGCVNFYRCTVHLDIIKVFPSPTDAQTTEVVWQHAATPPRNT
jgi:hypothetical protein